MTHRLLVGGELVLFGPTGVRHLFDEDEGFTAREVLEALAAVGVTTAKGNVLRRSP